MPSSIAGAPSRTAAVLDSSALYEQVWPEFDVSNGPATRHVDGRVERPVQLDAARFGSLLHSDTSIGTFNLSGLADPDIDALVADN